MSYHQVVHLLKENGHEFSDSKSKPTPIAMVAPELKKDNEADKEITKTCAVLCCDDFKSLDPELFFRFPEEPELRQIWTNLTGRNSWTPTDYSYICIQHFSVDSFYCNSDNEMVLTTKAVPSLKLPGHVLEVEYIDEETLENDGEEEYCEEEYYDEDMDSNYGEETHTDYNQPNSSQMEHSSKKDNYELLKLFTEVQKMQRLAVGLKDKLRGNLKLHNQQSRYLQRLKDSIALKQKLAAQKKRKRSRILLTLQDKIKEDTNGLVLAMPMRHTEDLKNFAMSIYKYSPQSYIYARNTLRTLLPSTDVLESWLKSGFKPRNVMSNNNLIKVVTEQTDSELNCKISLQ